MIQPSEGYLEDHAYPVLLVSQEGVASRLESVDRVRVDLNGGAVPGFVFVAVTFGSGWGSRPVAHHHRAPALSSPPAHTPFYALTAGADLQRGLLRLRAPSGVAWPWLGPGAILTRTRSDP